jgi:hypothetical protein
VSELMISTQILEGLFASLLVCLSFGIGFLIILFLLFVLFPWVRDEIQLWLRERK